MPIAVECPSCGKRYKFRDDLAGDTVPCKDCGEDIDVPGGRRSSGSRGRRKGKSGGGNAGLMIGGAAGGVVVLAIIGFLVMGRGGGGALPVPPGTAPGQGTFAPGGTSPSVAANPNAAPGTGNTNPKSGSRFDQPVVTAVPAGGAPKAPSLTGPKNPNLGVGLGNFVGVTKHWRNSIHGQRDANLEFKTLQEPPDQLPPDFWSVEVDPPAAPIVFEPKKKTVKVKVPNGANNRRSTTEDIIYPVVPSQFVAVGTNAQKKDNREIWNLGTGEKAGTISGLGVETYHGALSPDGRYYAAQAGFISKSLGVYDVEEKKPLGDIDMTGMRGGLTTIAIPKPNLLVAIGWDAHIWELPSGQPLHKIELGWQGWNRTLPIFSPGGRYMAQTRREHSSEEIWVHELDTAQVVGKLSMPSYDIGWGLTIDGMAFSTDGKELAATVNGWSCSKVLIWNVADGSLVDHMTFPKKLKEVVSNAQREATPLTWFPGNKRLLAFEHAIVDRDMGTVIWQIPKSSVEFTGKRWALDNSHVTVIDVNGNSGFVLVYDLPEEKIKASAERLAKTATSKKEDYPQVLGEQATPVVADFSGLKFIIPKEVPWGVSPDPAPASKTSTRPIQLATGGGGTVREVAVSRGDSPRAVSLRSNARDPFGRVANGNVTPTQLTQHRWHSVKDKVDDENSFTTQGSGKERAWVDVYDLTTGKKTLEVKMKQDGDLMGLSPDGSRFLCWAATKSGRLDLYSADDGKPLVGWNPYSTEGAGDAQTLVSATLIDATRALTLSAAGRLLLWQLPEARALLAIDNASQPAVSPTGKYLSYSDGLAYYFVELASGELRGRIADVGEVNAAAYHPGGEKLALLSSHKGAYYLFDVDLKTGNTSAPFPVPVLSGFLHWCGDRYVLLDNQRLVDLQQRVVAWTYELPAGDHLPTSPDGRHWFLADQGGKPTLTAAKLPGASAEAELAGAALQPEFVLQPGGKCSLNIQLGNLGDAAFAADIEKLLREQLAKHKIGVEPGQAVTLTLTATEALGETTKRTYSAFGQMGSEEISFTLKTMTCRAGFDAAGGSGWDNAATFSNETFFLRREKGQTIDQAIQANYLNTVKSYFRSIVLPPYVFTPKSAYGVGKTPLGAGPSS